MIITRGTFGDFFLETALPALSRVMQKKFRSKPKMMPKLFQLLKSDRSIEQGSDISGLGLAAEILEETGEVRIDSPVQGFDSLFKHRMYGIGAEWSRTAYADDKVRLIKRTAEELANSVDETIEIDGASVFNNAFSGSFLGPDGVSLCSASHPMIKRGGVQSNVLSTAADIAVASLKLALTDWMSMRRSNGHHVVLPTPRVLIPNKVHFDVHEILKGVYRSDTANHTPNPFQFGENGPIDQIMTWAKLTNERAWFLVAPPADTGLIWYWREKPYEAPFKDDRTERAGVAIRYRCSKGWEDYMGVYGTPGAS